jgi:hypothetical protein
MAREHGSMGARAQGTRGEEAKGRGGARSWSGRGGRRVRGLSLSAFVAAALLILSGCATFAYRDAQQDFNAAVQADNLQTAEALGALTGGQSDLLYERVRTQLSDAYIEKLDERLRPNAYAIRAVSEWRLGKLEDARKTAATGRQLPNVESSPRDNIVLHMIPALVIDAQLVMQFKKGGSAITSDEYQLRYEQDYFTAVGLLNNARAALQPSMPASTGYYLAFQRWRLLKNWKVIISKIQEDAGRRQAIARAGAQLGTPLDNEIANTAKLIPDKDPLYALMKSMEQQ